MRVRMNWRKNLKSRRQNITFIHRFLAPPFPRVSAQGSSPLCLHGWQRGPESPHLECFRLKTTLEITAKEGENIDKMGKVGAPPRRLCDIQTREAGGGGSKRFDLQLRQTPHLAEGAL